MLEKEASIIASARKEPAAFQPLYEAYYEPIFRFIYSKLNDEAETADLTSIVFLKALIGLPKYECRGYTFGTWLYKIAYNETLQYFRKHKRQRNLLISNEFIDTLYPESNEKSHELITKLEEAIQELEEKDVQLIELKYWEKKAYTEIAYIMDMRVSNAKTRMSRIYQKLENKLKKYLL